MTDKEKIERIEQAPKEVQTMVAKAFLRDDIPDDEIQYLFNDTPFEELNEDDVIIENINAEQPEGIGATGFTIRNTKPYDNKQYITRSSGGYSNCIKGYPTDSHANVLANCVGYASGRFNEIIELARDFHECRYTNLRCNASGFIQRAIEAGLETGMTPRTGAIMCWGGGNNNCGHVAVVEIYDKSLNKIQTSESDYGGTAFYNAIRTNSNGRWGLSSSFYFQGFIYQPQDVQEWIDGKPKEELAQPVKRDEHLNQIEVKVDDLRIRDCGGLACKELGKAKKGFYNYYEIANNNGYKWYRITNDWRRQWIASSDEWTTVYPKKDFVVGDTIKVKGTYKIVDTKDNMACVFMSSKETWLPYDNIERT